MWKQQPSLMIIALVFSMCCFVAGFENLPINYENVEATFEQYVEQFNKSYRCNKDEYKKRFELFQKSLAVINSMNTLRTHKDSARYGFTEYSDMSNDEFISMKLIQIQSNQILNRRKNSITKEVDGMDTWRRNFSTKMIRYQRDTTGNVELPKRIDWRERGVVSQIRNQGTCGACWAHSVIGTVESMISIEGNSSTLVELSVQQMIDCAANNNGCRGGDICNLLDWLLEERVNIQTMEEYPTVVEGSRCKMSDRINTSQTVQIKSFTCSNYVGQEEKILQILANYGPVAVAVNGLLWQNYLGGIIQFHCNGSIANLNHAVQIVGYDTTGEVPYYIVRNSWGRKFGNKGYLKIQIGGNICGVANQVSTLNIIIGQTKPK